MSGLTLKVNTMIPIWPIKPVYRIYTALLTQEGSSIPSAVELYNQFNITPIFTRLGAGLYEAEFTGLTFDLNKTTLSIQNNYFFFNTINNLENAIGIGTFINATTPADDLLLSTMIEIRIYT